MSALQRQNCVKRLQFTLRKFDGDVSICDAVPTSSSFFYDRKYKLGHVLLLLGPYLGGDYAHCLLYCFGTDENYDVFCEILSHTAYAVQSLITAQHEYSEQLYKNQYYGN